jgi:prepilin-type N-terminal cleavage/methylation domain-containing protein
MNKMIKNLRKNDGFTLIEILVVIGIIAILAVIVLIAINPARQFQQARNTQRTSNVNAILNAVGQYVADNKGDLPTIPGGEVNTTLCNQLVSDYLPAMPTDPDSATDGAEIACADIDPGDVDYNVTQGADDRITVSAPNAELGETIEVTR